MNHVHSLLVDGDNQVLREAGVGHLVNFEESGAICWPSVDNFQEGNLGLVRAHPRVFVVGSGDLLLPLMAGHYLGQVTGNQTLQTRRDVCLSLGVFDSVDQSSQDCSFLLCTLVIASEEFWKLLVEMKNNIRTPILPWNCT